MAKKKSPNLSNLGKSNNLYKAEHLHQKRKMRKCLEAEISKHQSLHKTQSFEKSSKNGLKMLVQASYEMLGFHAKCLYH